MSICFVQVLNSVCSILSGEFINQRLLNGLHLQSQPGGSGPWHNASGRRASTLRLDVSGALHGLLCFGRAREAQFTQRAAMVLQGPGFEEFRAVPTLTHVKRLLSSPLTVWIARNLHVCYGAGGMNQTFDFQRIESKDRVPSWWRKASVNRSFTTVQY
jgi:hypothetical protein